MYMIYIYRHHKTKDEIRTCPFAKYVHPFLSSSPSQATTYQASAEPSEKISSVAHIRIVLSHYKDPYDPTSRMEGNKGLNIAHVLFFVKKSFSSLAASPADESWSTPFLVQGAFFGGLKDELSNEKNWLFSVYRGLYYPVMWGLCHKPL